MRIHQSLKNSGRFRTSTLICFGAGAQAEARLSGRADAPLEEPLEIPQPSLTVGLLLGRTPNTELDPISPRSAPKVSSAPVISTKPTLSPHYQAPSSAVIVWC